MKIAYQSLLQSLNNDLDQNLEKLQVLQSLLVTELNLRSNEKSWSILECIHHLNLYGEYYIPHLEKALLKSQKRNHEVYKSGWLGNYFSNMMAPKENIVKNPMPAPSDKNPIGSNLDTSVLDVRHQQIDKLKQLLLQANELNLEKVRIPITISKWIKLKTGDTFRFLIAHEVRHFLQCQNIIKNNGIKIRNVKNLSSE
ncbi:DinB family protein [Flammeovirga pacifica]|uniref:DinB-like domain-containing protein n=1 Tax=Flammeovirga pacifica TaxID=915059 RepID=A0A1S1YVN1_FLAPC|nr:DinB family protein [Flammeovirga pacifica]OHX65084.1 hypothetical protein NH26_01320 [Flammeovirga pacifica]